MLALALAALFLLPTVLAQVPVFSGDADSGRDAGPGRETAVRIAPGTHSGSFVDRDDVVDTYVFDAPAGALVQLEARSAARAGSASVGSPSSAPRLALEAPDGRVNSRALGSQSTFLAWAGGEWMVQLRRGVGATYEFHLGVATLPLQDDAGIGGDATPLWTSPTRVSAGTITGWVGGVDDADSYVAQLEPGDWRVRLETPAVSGMKLLVEHEGRRYGPVRSELTLRVGTVSDLRFAAVAPDAADDYAIHVEPVLGMLPDDAFHTVRAFGNPFTILPAGDGGSIFALGSSRVLRVDEDGSHPHLDAELRELAGLDDAGRVIGLDHMRALRSYDASGAVPLHMLDYGFREIRFGPDGGAVALADGRGKNTTLVSLHPDGTKTSVELSFAAFHGIRLAFAPDGTLYAATSYGIERIDRATGVMERVASLPLAGPLAFDAEGFAYAVTRAEIPTLVRIDLASGEATPLAYAPKMVAALAFSGERLWLSEWTWCCAWTFSYYEVGVTGFEGFRSQLTSPPVAELAVTSVRVEPRYPLSPDQPVLGREHWRVVVDVANLGEADVVEPFHVYVSARGSPGILGGGGPIVSTTSWSAWVDPLPAGVVTTIAIEWDVTARVGNFTVEAVADAHWLNRVLEVDETENNRNRTQVFVRANSDPAWDAVVDLLR